MSALLASKSRACRPALGLALLVVFAARSVAASGEGPPSLNPMAAFPKAELKAFVNAPLFDPTRRLPPPAPAMPVLPPPVVATVEQPPAVELVGVIQGAQPEAIVQDGGRTTVLHTGDRLGNWFAEVLPTVLRLHSGLRAYDYAMFQVNGHSGPLAVDSDAAIAAEQPPVTGRSVQPDE